MDQGLCLDRYLRERGPLKVRQAVKIVVQIARQLEADGEQGLVHPGRLQAQKDGSVRLLPPPQNLALPTLVEFPAYASPEEIGGGRADLRSTLYSVGCTFFELLAGAPPYAGGDSKEVLRAHLETAPPDVRDFTSGVPDSVAETLRDLLVKDPDLRIQDTQELARRLQLALQAKSTEQKPGRNTTTEPSKTRTAKTRMAKRPPRRAAPSARAPDADTASLETEPEASPRRPGRSSAAGSRRVGTASRKRTPARKGARSPDGRDPGVERSAPERPRTRSTRGMPRRGTRGRRRQNDFDDEYQDDGIEQDARGGRAQRRLVFSWIGGGLGLLIGLLLLLSASKRQEENEATAAVKAKEHIVVEGRNQLKARKEKFADTQIKRRDEATASLKRLQTVTDMSPEKRYDFIAMAVNNFCDTSVGPDLADELIRAWETANTAQQEEANEGFSRIKEEAQELYEQGKLTAAIDRMMDADKDYKKTHGDSIDEFVTRVSEELTERWKTDDERARALAKDGEPEKAITVLEKALTYGDYPIRKGAQQMIDSIRAQAGLHEDKEDKALSDEEEEELEDEFKNFGEEEE